MLCVVFVSVWYFYRVAVEWRRVIDVIVIFIVLLHSMCMALPQVGLSASQHEIYMTKISGIFCCEQCFNRCPFHSESFRRFIPISLQRVVDCPCSTFCLGLKKMHCRILQKPKERSSRFLWNIIYNFELVNKFANFVYELVLIFLTLQSQGDCLSQIVP